MKPSERDSLLIRLDVRTENIEKTTEKQEKHLAQLNDKVAKNILNIDRTDRRLNTVEKAIENGVNLRFTKKQTLAGGGSLATLIATVILILGKSLGWF